MSLSLGTYKILTTAERKDFLSLWMVGGRDRGQLKLDVEVFRA